MAAANNTSATTDLAERYHAICATLTRHPSAPTLVAVSKQQPLERIEALLALGHRCFGENRIQDIRRIWPGIKARYQNVQLHMIGPLQTNKLKHCLDICDALHSVDRPTLVRALGAAARARPRLPQLFVQVNTGEEAQKSGVKPAALPALLAQCAEEKLTIDGLMCLPPQSEPAAPHFALLQKLAQRHGLTKLSMGMSHDYKQALPFGATHIRLGEAVFGPRPQVAQPPKHPRPAPETTNIA